MSSKQRKRKSSPVKCAVALGIALVLTIACLVLGLNGMKLDGRGLHKLLPWIPTTDAENWPQSLSLGLDLRGGVYVEYTAEKLEEVDGDLNNALDSTVSVILTRLTDKGYPEATVQKINNNTGIRVEVPDVKDPQAVLDLIGSTAKLSFRTSQSADSEFMNGSHITQAYVTMNPENSEYEVAFKLNADGAKIFADVTTQYLNQPLYIFKDDELVSAPRVQSAITGGSGVINGMAGLEEAQTLATQIQSGALPVKLTLDKKDTVSATLGDNALSTSVKAALIGILLIMALMIVRYRVNGLVASWALIVYIVALFFLVAVLPGIQMTLPGLAGIVLGIGMAVDANVVIYERFNEELRAGKSTRNALRAGFKNALRAILDSNVTTMIAGVVLLIFGTGSVQGFAKTLLLGVAVSMVSAVLVTRFLMHNLIGVGLNKPSMYCAVKAEKEVEQ